jgi:hypothetical protein
MASYDEVKAALTAAQELQAKYERRFARALGLMADRTWEGGGSSRFLAKLTGMDQSHRQQLGGLVSDLEHLLAHTPKPPVPTPMPGPPPPYYK